MSTKEVYGLRVSSFFGSYINREKFVFGEVYQEMLELKHNALYDAKLIMSCHKKPRKVLDKRYRDSDIA